MIALAVLCALGLLTGFLLLVRVPLCSADASGPVEPASVIIPARNEAKTLPRLLGSIPQREDLSLEAIVVDDHSTDATASVAQEYGARVLAAPPLEGSWTGKTSACFAGAAAAREDNLLFLDADTWFEPGGLMRLLATFSAQQQPVALSVLPFHVTSAPYEELSLFFNLLMAFGAGGFGVLGRARLFGQSLLLERALYVRSGTHRAVRGDILENVALAKKVAAAGGRCVCHGGRGVLRMRMFPDGFRQMCEGWTKAFASGAAASSGVTLAAAIFWLTALCVDVLWLLLATGTSRCAAGVFYFAFVLQVAWFARQVGTFRWYTCVVFPVPLLFFFAIFARSLKRRVLRQPVSWRGRQV